MEFVGIIIVASSILLILIATRSLVSHFFRCPKCGGKVAFTISTFHAQCKRCEEITQFGDDGYH